ncbi:MAG TPA: hypothetical protein VMJ11_03950 [Paraburkholderia sp.]|uniref:HAD family hydrolase n=1 Tax=Paraburkholderia sp. TaxID=1926495 RepID=UPI002C6ADA0C|nr:hypothetical protein [Paraburkholderia sp.]HTR05808.1 hypothetical protein [Paraburkholderia sp.]
MITIDIPGFGTLRLTHLILDFNGTLAVDGRILPGIATRMAALANDLNLHVVTGNTHGDAQDQLRDCAAEVVCLAATGQAQAKRDYALSLGQSGVVAIGNGRNDALMLKQSALGIAVLGTEGLAADALAAADIVVRHAEEGLDLLLKPKRLIATLRA